MSDLVEKFKMPFMQSLSNLKLRQQTCIWVNFRKLLQIFEGCEPWIVDVHKWNQYRIWGLLEKPQKVVRLVQNHRFNIQRIHPRNIEMATDNLSPGDHQYSQYLAKLIEYLVQQYENLINEEQIANYLDQSDEAESRMRTQESVIDFQEQPSMDLSMSKPSSALRKSTTRSNTTDTHITNLQQHQQKLEQQIEHHREILRELEEELNRTKSQMKRMSGSMRVDKILNNLNRSRRNIY